MASNCLSIVTEIENLEITAKPNWLELPKDLTMDILQRLPTLELVTSASVVCPLWWNICKDPLLWRTIDMFTGISLSYIGNKPFSRLENICCYAINRSCGHLKNIYIKKFATNDLLTHIASSASQLRCIRLEKCYAISNEALQEIMKKQPFLEELEICHSFSLSKDLFEYIGRSCPLLKSLKFIPVIEVTCDDKCDDVAFSIAKTMPKLKHLTILNNELTNNGLLAILDGCPLLESLDVRGCLYVDLDGSLGKRCISQIKVLRFPAESTDHKGDYKDYNDYINHCMVCSIGDFDFSWIDDIPESDISDFDFY